MSTTSFTRGSLFRGPRPAGDHRLTDWEAGLPEWPTLGRVSTLAPVVLVPELLWGSFYLLCDWLATRTFSGNPSADWVLLVAGVIGGVLALAVSCGAVVAPGAQRRRLLWRWLLSTVIGLNACLFRLFEGLSP